mmetsp:Transcript_25634/g.81579  ORF Transcript_25634/g.81579 Transcript_25634/m.81579 type:complete len:203 (-) Transcript_25634:1349-1957(-)
MSLPSSSRSAQTSSSSSSVPCGTSNAARVVASRKLTQVRAARTLLPTRLPRSRLRAGQCHRTQRPTRPSAPRAAALPTPRCFSLTRAAGSGWTPVHSAMASFATALAWAATFRQCRTTSSGSLSLTSALRSCRMSFASRYTASLTPTMLARSRPLSKTGTKAGSRMWAPATRIFQATARAKLWKSSARGRSRWTSTRRRSGS